ncbi:MAG TPA: aspartyl protease family protein [Pyrinomonadaceae bacterium]|nr:aspartyl protease family protein [Pyrinomonadaceae bacterium]
MKRTNLLAPSGLLLAFLLSTVSAVPLIYSAQTASVATPPAVQTKPITIPFELANRHIMLKVQINNAHQLSFVLDTGDKYAIIDLDRASELGLQLGSTVRMQGAGSETPTGAFVRDASFSIPGLDGFSQPLNLALPIKRLAARLGQDFDGIIGHDFIKNFVVEIDYQARHLKLHDKKSFSYAGPGESVPIKINYAGHPIIDAEVTPVGGEPIKGKFVVDIGSGLALALHSPTVRARNLPGPNTKTIKSLGLTGAGGAVGGQLGRVAELKVGSFRLKNPITFFSEDTAGAFANSELVGNIGAQAMNRFRVFLDYERERIILEPSSMFEKSYDRAFTGLSINAEGKDYRTFRVTDVLENSPASEIRLQKDDVIFEIDGRPASGFTLSKLNELFERPVSYELTVKRGDQTVKVRLTPRMMV